MRLNSRLFKLSFLLIFLSCIPIQITQSSTNVGTLYSYAENDPCYDGYLESTIWDTTRAIDITLYNLADQEENMTITLLSVYNTVNGSLSFGIIVPDTTLNDDIFALVFKTNTSADLVVYDGEWKFTGWNDMKGAFFQYNESADGVTFDNDLDGTSDIYTGGFENTYGKCTWDGLQYVFEMHTFLNITDPLGADYRLGENSQIEFFVMFQEASLGGGMYTQIREDDGDYDYCILNIGEPASTAPSTVITNLFVLGSVIASFTVITYLSRKRK